MTTTTPAPDFPAVYAAHERPAGSPHATMAATYRAILDAPDVAPEHRATALRAVRSHVAFELRAPGFSVRPGGWYFRDAFADHPEIADLYRDAGVRA